MNKELSPLKFETISGTNLYECEHVTSNTYPIESALPVGYHTNILLCRHCWQHMEGIALEGILKNILREQISESSELILRRLLDNSREDQISNER